MSHQIYTKEEQLHTYRLVNCSIESGLFSIVQHRGVEHLKLGDIIVLFKLKTKGQVALEVKNKNTLVDVWKSSPADQDGASLLWSSSDETSLQSLIKNDITKDKTSLGQERRQISQSYSIAKDNGDINSEIITAIEKAMLKCFIEDAKNDNPSE